MTTSASEIVTGVDFIGLPTRDLERSVQFYGDTLGLPRAVYMPDRGFAEFETGNLTINIMNATKMGLQHNVFQSPLALHVDDVAAARELLESRGVEFAGDTFDTGVCRMAFFSDPDGNSLMLHHRYQPRVTDS
jgi:predicted enzyme related to lactoylglutathione lyase